MRAEYHSLNLDWVLLHYPVGNYPNLNCFRNFLGDNWQETNVWDWGNSLAILHRNYKVYKSIDGLLLAGCVFAQEERIIHKY